MLRYLFLLKEFVRRDFEGRYAGSMLGFLWSLLQPGWQLLLFTFVFSTVLKISLLGERTENFGIFLFCGLMPWLAFHEGVSRSSTAITENANLVKKIHFPAEILVLSVVLGGVVHQLIASGLFIAVLAVVGEFHWRGLSLIAIALPIQIAFTVGLGLVVATANTFFRDVGQLLGMVLMGWFYFTPIVYPLDQVPEQYQSALLANPMTSLVGLYREAFLGGHLGAARGLEWLLVTTGIALACGLWLFRRMKPLFPDEL